MIVRGTTPIHTFKLPCTKENIAKISICYYQNKRKMVEKTLEDCYFTNRDEVQVQLTQGDTLTFECGPTPKHNIVLVQVRILLLSGQAIASEIVKEKLAEILRESPLTFPFGCGCNGSTNSGSSNSGGNSGNTTTDDFIIYDGGDVHGYGYGYDCTNGNAPKPPIGYEDDVVVYDGGGVSGYGY